MNLKHFVTLDFETYYAKTYTLSKLTTEEYIRDPRFETIGCGVKVGAAPSVWMAPDDFRKWAGMWDWANSSVLAHNTAFDGRILSYHYNVKPAFWLDTLSMARALHRVEVGHSLAKLMMHYQVGEKGTEVIRALGKRLHDFTPEEWLRYGDYCNTDTQGCYDIFWKMVEVFPESELHVIDTTLRMFTEPTFVLDEPMLEEYLIEERARKQELLDRIMRDKSVLMSNPKLAQLLFEMGVEPPRKISPATFKETWAFAKSDPGMKELLGHDREDVRWVAEARVGVKSTINETRTARFLTLGKDGARVPVFLKYAAAHTYRWGGGDKTNFQNLQRGGTLRKALMAPEGKVLVVADSAQIEARGAAWMAGHTPLVEAFREKRDVYSEFASEAYGRHVDRKANPEDKDAGNVGKTCVLGLGYGMGWKKLAASLLQGPMGADPIQFTLQDAQNLGISPQSFIEGKRGKKYLMEIREMPSRLPLEELITHCAVAAHFVWTYRGKNKPIAELWKTMDHVLKAMVECEVGEGMSFGPNDTFVATRHAIMMPNGLLLYYPGLQWTEPVTEEGRGHYSYIGARYGKKRVKAYGGLMTENLVQTFCRNIIAEQMQRLRQEFGYHIVTTTHDEIVAVVDEKDGDKALENMLDVMKTPPSWCADLPLNAEGSVAKRYGEAK